MNDFLIKAFCCDKLLNTLTSHWVCISFKDESHKSILISATSFLFVCSLRLIQFNGLSIIRYQFSPIRVWSMILYQYTIYFKQVYLINFRALIDFAFFKTAWIQETKKTSFFKKRSIKFKALYSTHVLEWKIIRVLENWIKLPSLIFSCLFNNIMLSKMEMIFKLHLLSW